MVDGGVVGAGCVPPVGAAPVGGATLVGAGVNGMAGFAPVGAVAGADAGGGANVLSSTERGARLRVDASASKNDRPRNSPPHHQLAFVRRLPACRVPMNELAELLTPPNDAAIPPP